MSNAFPIILAVLVCVMLTSGCITGQFAFGEDQEQKDDIADNISNADDGSDIVVHITPDEKPEKEEPPTTEEEPEPEEPASTGGGFSGGSSGGGGGSPPPTPPEPPPEPPNNPPVLDGIGDKSFPCNETMQFPVTASDPDGDSVLFYITDMPEGAEFQNQTFTWTPTSKQIGTFPLTFTVTDGELNDSEAITITVEKCYSTRIYVDPETSNLQPGSDFTVTVRIETEENVFAADVILEYDKDILNATDAQEGDFLGKDGSNTWAEIETDHENGTVNFISTRMANGNVIPGVSGDGGLFSISFDALQIGNSNLKFTYLKIIRKNDEGKLEEVTDVVYDGGTVNVQ